MARVKKDKPPVCRWREGGDFWEGACGIAWCFTADGGPVEHLQHRLVSLFHQPQLHEHGRPPSDLWARTTTAKKVAAGEWWTPIEHTGVVQVPEPPSPRYRSRVREVSDRYRSHGVHCVPGPHKATFHGFSSNQ